MKDNRTIKAENVLKAIKNQGYFYILAEKYYDEGYIGPKYIIATDDPSFREKHPSLAEMVIVSIDKFLKMAEAINSSILNDRRENFRQMHFHNEDGFYEEINDDEEAFLPLAISDISMDPVFDSLMIEVTRESLMNVIDQLKETQRRRIVAYYFEGKTQLEIAAEEGVNLYAIQKSLNGSLKKIKSLLEKGW